MTSDEPTRDLVIYGSKYRDVVKLVAAINRQAPRWRLLGFIDDAPEAAGGAVFGHPVLGTRERLPALVAAGAAVFCNVTGQVWAARQVLGHIEAAGASPVSLVHPGVDLAYVTLGAGAIVQDGCLIGSGTVVGRCLAMRLQAVISHDVRVGDHVFLGAGAIVSSECVLETGAFIGAGAVIKPGCRVGRHSIVGAGAVVSADLPDESTAGPDRLRVVPGRGRE